MIFIEPLNRLIKDNKAFKGEKVREEYFGGFCECGGIMFQKSWFSDDGARFLISECEKCWKNELISFNGNQLAGEKEEVQVIDRVELREFLREYLSPSEYEALVSKGRGESYNSSALSRAKRRLEDIGITIEEILGFI